MRIRRLDYFEFNHLVELEQHMIVFAFVFGELGQ